MKSFFGTYNSAELRSATHAAAMKETRGGIMPGASAQVNQGRRKCKPMKFLKKCDGKAHSCDAGHAKQGPFR
jgi:hypothetical protein